MHYCDNKTLRYSLAILRHAIAVGNTPVRASDLAEKHKAPKAYIAKIMSSLTNAGLLRSARGPRGGFVISPDFGKPSLWDIGKAAGVFSDAEEPTNDENRTVLFAADVAMKKALSAIRPFK